MEQVTVKLMGVQQGTKKDGTDFYRADLYLDGVGAFDRTLTAAQYVELSKLPTGAPLVLGLRLAIEDRNIPNGRGGTFTVRGLGVRVGDISLPENVRKAG